MKRLAGYWISFLMLISLPACAQQIDVDRPIEEIRAEAQKMSKGALEKKARQYADAIAVRRDEARRVQDQIREMAIRGQETKEIIKLKERAGVLAGEISKLNWAYDPYMHYYVEKGGDYEKIKLPRN